MSSFNLKLLAADKVFYEGPCEYINIPTIDGSFGILPHHINIVSAILAGKLTYRLADGNTYDVAVSEGLVKVEDNEVLVLVHTAERPEDIDKNRARRAKEEAERKLKMKLSKKEYHEARLGLMRALNRLNISNK